MTIPIDCVTFFISESNSIIEEDSFSYTVSSYPELTLSKHTAHIICKSFNLPDSGIINSKDAKHLIKKVDAIKLTCCNASILKQRLKEVLLASINHNKTISYA